MTRVELLSQLESTIRDADHHSCNYGETIPYDEMAEAVLEFLEQKLGTMVEESK